MDSKIAEAVYEKTETGFNPLAYLLRNPDVLRSKADPFKHFVLHGQTEKRKYYFDDVVPEIYLVCIMKKEEKYLFEWIAHHRNEGFRKIIIGDNGGSDEQTRILTDLNDLGFVKRVDLLGKERAQMAFYNNILAEYRHTNAIIGFIDTDEFIRSSIDTKPATELIAGIFGDRKIGALGVNWAIFGSNGKLAASDELVQKRFSKRSRPDFSPNLHVKSFVRCKASDHFVGNPHAVVLKSDYRYVYTDTTDLAWGPKGAGIAEKVVWGAARLDHYILKSREEYDIRKMRGSATHEINDHAKRAETYFESFDKNDVEDPITELRLAALSAEVLFLKSVTSGMQKRVAAPMAKPQLTFTPEVSSFISTTYTSASTILEYGSGGSTALAAEMPGTTVFSVEIDRDWVAMMQRWFVQEPPRGTVHLSHVDIGPTKEWGYPKDESRRAFWIDYPMAIWERPDLVHPDVVLIDGRFRVACFLATLMNIRRPTTILFDDYGDRPHYHVVEELLPPTRHVGRLAVFDAKPRALHPADLRRFGSYFFRPE